MAMFKKLIITGILLFAPFVSFAQSVDPAAVEDIMIERQKILRASDQVEIMYSQMEQFQKDIQWLRKEVVDLRSDNQKLRQELAQYKTQQAKERDTLLTEVSKSVEEATQKAVQIQPTPTPVKETSQRGFEHTVEKGQTLWLIAKAYREQKNIDVSVDDIRKANGISRDATIRVGQKLFIPVK